MLQKHVVYRNNIDLHLQMVENRIRNNFISIGDAIQDIQTKRLYPQMNYQESNKFLHSCIYHMSAKIESLILEYEEIAKYDTKQDQ